MEESYTVTVSNSYGTTISSTTYRYTYDANGNITAIRDGSNAVVAQYTYDSLGQLTQEINVPLNRRYVWTYDDAGNILSKKTYNKNSGTLIETQNYSYSTGSWGDLLTQVGSNTIEYDSIGNPTQWGENSGGIWYDGAILEWQGRQLQSFQAFRELDGDYMDADYAVYFKYNFEGIRTEKITDAGNHEYILNGSQIIGEWIANRSKLIVYLYDENGTPIGMKIRDYTQAEGEFDEYFFEKNLQGDIVAVYNMDGEKIGSYTYDAWGNFKTTLTSGNTTLENEVVNTYNPFRYRGYYYDVETGLYYLQSRYYNPAWGRFINADAYVSTGQGLIGNNMFAYCGNNPVNRVDDTGKFWLAALLVTAVVAVCVTLSGCSTVSEDTKKYGNVSPGYFETVEDAVVDFGENYLFDSIKKDKEVGTAIYKEEHNGKEYYTYYRVNLGDIHSVKIPFDSVKDPVAIVHTHGNYSNGYIGNEFSKKDKKLSQDKNVPIYLFTPEQLLLKYDPQDGSETLFNDWKKR